MKQLLITILCLTLFTNCENTTADITPEADAFSFKIDGEAYAPDPIHVDIQNLSGIAFVGIYADFGSEEALFLTVRDDITPGSYSIDISNEIGVTQAQCRYYYNPTSASISESADAKEGTLVILKNDTETRRMAGTFHFDTFPVEQDEPIFKITEGVFDVSY